MSKPVSVLMVCLGNICRSPTAEGVLRELIKRRGLHSHIRVDSAGTSDWHVGEPPDPRTVSSASRRGYELSSLVGRQVSHGDFEEFDYILAMDKNNFLSLKNVCPPEYYSKLALLLEFGPGERLEVPDPYYSGAAGFELVLDLIEKSGEALLDSIVEKHGLKAS